MMSQDRTWRFVINDLIDLHAWQYGSGDWFTARLFALMGHADSQNRYKLGLGFPRQLWVFQQWEEIDGVITGDMVENPKAAWPKLQEWNEAADALDAADE